MSSRTEFSQGSTGRRYREHRRDRGPAASPWPRTDRKRLRLPRSPTEATVPSRSHACPVLPETSR